MITQTELKALLHYDPDTGIFVRRVGNHGCIAGTTAGTTTLKGYRQICLFYKLYLAHRLAWLYVYGNFPKDQIDHINGAKSDNRICNIRESTSGENLRNQGKKGCNTTGYKGVSVCKKRYRAKAIFEKKRYHLGLYKTPEQASKAYQAFAKKHHGAFYYDEFII
jgi:hypothetical protein